MESDPTFDLLVVDFGGVCTPTHEEFLAGSRPPASIRPGAVAVVSAARDLGMIVAVLSNELDPAWAADMPLLRMMDHVVSCTDNGILKPDRRAYERVLLLTGASAQRTLFVDDDPDNVVAAAAVGLQTIRFDPNAPDASWDAVADRLGVVV